MIVDRMIARLAAVAALNNFMQAPYPTLAGSRIFDSRIEAVEDFKKHEMLPVCVVYTDYDKDHWLHFSTSNRDRVLTVTFELLVAQLTEIPSEDGSGTGDYVVEFPNTDSELETSLDIFEQQVANALVADNVAADCWRRLMVKYVNVVSRRGATVEGGTKLAARQITIEASVPRGPANGIIPQEIAAFLDELESHDDFVDRVPAIRDLYTGAADLTHAEQILRAMGWTTEGGTIIGYERGVQVFLPADVVYTDENGQPFP